MATRFFASLLLLLSLSLTAQAQVNFGIRAGVTTTSIDVNDLNILSENGMQNLQLSLQEARYGVHAGILLRFQMKSFFIQPEVLFNSNQSSYTIADAEDMSLIGEVFSEKYQYLDIPVMFGFKAGPVRLNAGPVGHVFINSTSELFDLDGYEQRFDDFTFGWQAGLGLDLWKFTVDVRYEGNFSKYGDHIEFFGRRYAFDQAPSRLIFSVGYLFGDR